MITDLKQLFMKMLRFRTALMLLLFVAIADGATKHDINSYSINLLFVIGVLAFWYVFSTSTNDLADEAIDRVNLKGNHERPLANDQTSRKALWQAAILSALVALLLAFVISPWSLLITAAAIALSSIYSFPPIRLSARGIVAPLLLPIGYIAFPFALVQQANAGVIDSSFIVLLAALYLSFSGRIILKDFRDVKGDAKFGKRTFLVRHGARATSMVSAGFWLTGLALIITRFRDNPLLLGCIFVMTLCTFAALRVLPGVSKIPDQLQYVGLIGRLANGSALLILVAVYAEHSPKEGTMDLLLILLTVFNLFTCWSLYEKPMRTLLNFTK